VSEIACVNHPERLALAYCAGCGKALCGRCVVRLSAGNYCEVCAETPDHRPPSSRTRRGRLWVWAGLAAAVTAALLLSRVL
jgi:hypothetical protein